MLGKVIGVCLSKRRTDPKENVGKGFLQKGFGLVGDSHGGTEKEVSLSFCSGVSLQELPKRRFLVGDRSIGPRGHDIFKPITALQS